MHIESDDAAVGGALKALAGTVADNGGFFSPSARTVCREGDLTIAADQHDTPGNALIQVPEACLPPISAFDLSASDDSIVIDGDDDALADVQRTTFRQMIDVYNACGKLAQWRHESPWFALAEDGDLFEHLLSARPSAKKVQACRELRDSGRWDELLVWSFLGSRTFLLGPAPGRNGSDQGEPVLMPFIDFQNHDFRARSYQFAEDGTGSRVLWTQKVHPVAESDECFVCYNLMDSLDTYLTYGFVDESAPILNSVPVEVELSNGCSLSVRGESGPPFKRELPPGMRDARLFMPQIREHEPDRFVVSRLFLPGPNAPRALRRVLAYLIRSLRPAAPNDAVLDAVLEAETQVLQANESFYMRLAELCAQARNSDLPSDIPGRSDALHAVERLVERQQAYLEQYTERLGD